MQDRYLNGKYIDWLVQQRRNSIANALELRLCCTNPSIGNTLGWTAYPGQHYLVSLSITYACWCKRGWHQPYGIKHPAQQRSDCRQEGYSLRYSYMSAQYFFLSILPNIYETFIVSCKTVYICIWPRILLRGGGGGGGGGRGSASSKLDMSPGICCMILEIHSSLLVIRTFSSTM